MVNDPTPTPLEQRSRELFEDSVSRLDAQTRSRLNQARQNALTELKKGRTRRYWLGAPLGGLAAAVLVAVLLVSGRAVDAPKPDAPPLPLDDFDILADADSLALIQDVEFYSWLADVSGADTNSTG